MGTEISDSLLTTLSGLCQELQNFFYETESSLYTAKRNFEQVQNVLKPWKIPKIESAKSNCTCACSSVQSEENIEDAALLNTIKKTLSTAESIRQKTSKKPSENSLKKKSSSSVVKKPTSQPLTSHNPSCPLSKTSSTYLSKSDFTLTESLSFYKIPSSFIETIRKSREIMDDDFKPEVENKYKKLFREELDRQNENSCTLYKKQDQSIDIYLTYLTAFQSYQNKLKNVNNGWIFYNDKQNLKNLQISKYNLHVSDSWSIIIKYIIKELMPELELSQLNCKQKIYLYKLIKSICNYASSSGLSVPIFKIRPLADNKE